MAPPTGSTGPMARNIPPHRCWSPTPKADSVRSAPNGVGCVVPPVGAQFYPYYSVQLGEQGWQQWDGQGCALLFGNVRGPGIATYGRDVQYGTPDLAWFFGQQQRPARQPVSAAG
jgi:hypothetical protein